MGGEDFRVERLEIRSAANDDAVDVPRAGGGLDVRQRDGAHGGAEVKLHAMGGGEPSGQAADGLAGVDSGLGRAPEGAEQAVDFGGGGAGDRFLGCEQGAAVGGAVGRGGEFAEHGPFVGAVGEMERAGGIEVEARGGGDLAPKLAAAEGAVVAGAGGLADGPDEAEVADGSADGGRGALEEHDAETASRGGERVGETDDAGTDDGDVGMERSTHARSLPGGRRRGQTARRRVTEVLPAARGRELQCLSPAAGGAE